MPADVTGVLAGVNADVDAGADADAGAGADVDADAGVDSGGRKTGAPVAVRTDTNHPPLNCSPPTGVTDELAPGHDHARPLLTCLSLLHDGG